MAATGTSFNRLVSSTITAADLAAQLDWVAVNIDTSGGNVALVDSIEFHVNATGADYNNLQILTAQVVKNASFNPALAIGVQLGAGIETHFSTIAPLQSERTIWRPFTQPLVLEAGSKYVIWGRAFYSAFAGPVGYEMTIGGRLVGASGQAFPFDLR
jgi:hypothetical protein